MKLDELVAIHVGESSLDSTLVKGFLQTAPQYHSWGLAHQIDPAGLAQLASIDLVEFYLRTYLIGRHKTLRACLRETQAFVRQDAQEAHPLLIFSLEHTRQTLLQLEWYELLPRLAAARERVLVLAPGGVCPTRPWLVRRLEESCESVNSNA